MQGRTISMRAMQVMVDLVMDLLDMIAREADSIFELESKETLTIDEIPPYRCKTRIARRQGQRESLPSSPAAEPPALRHINVHSIHELDCRDVSACCDGVGRYT